MNYIYEISCVYIYDVWYIIYDSMIHINDVCIYIYVR